MNNQYESFEKPENLNNNNNFAVIALFVCFLSFSLSVATPWFMGAFAPPPPVVEEVEEPGMTEKLLCLLCLGGEEAEATEPDEGEEETRVSSTRALDRCLAFHGYDDCARGAALRNHCSVTKAELLHVAGTAIFFGVAAIVIQYIVMAIIVFTILVILVFLLSAIGVEF